jgi:hypothetical protein
MFVIGTTTLIMILLALCVGVILGAFAVMSIYRNRDQRLWETVNNRIALFTPAFPVPQTRPAPVQVVTSAPRRVPADILGDDTVINPKYTPTGLDNLRASMTDRGFPGTGEFSAVREPDFTGPLSAFRDVPEPEPARDDYHEAPDTDWRIPYNYQAQPGTVAAEEPSFVWPSGESREQLLDRLEREAWGGRVAICG